MELRLFIVVLLHCLPHVCMKVAITSLSFVALLLFSDIAEIILQNKIYIVYYGYYCH